MYNNQVLSPFAPVDTKIKVKKEKTEEDSDTKHTDTTSVKDEKPSEAATTKVKKEDSKGTGSSAEQPVVLSKAVKEENGRLLAENKRLQDLVTQLQQRHHEINIRVGTSPIAFQQT